MYWSIFIISFFVFSFMKYFTYLLNVSPRLHKGSQVSTLFTSNDFAPSEASSNKREAVNEIVTCIRLEAYEYAFTGCKSISSLG